MKLPTALPTLSGRWLAGYRMLWFATLALALIGVTIGNWANYQRLLGWDRALNGAGFRIIIGQRATISPMGSAAEKSGLRTNSILLAVDGVPVPIGNSDATALAIAKAVDGPVGRVLRLKVRAPDGTVSSHTLVRGPQHRAEAEAKAPMTNRARRVMNLILGFMVGLAFLAAAILLFRRRVNDPVVALLALGLLFVPVGAVVSFAVPNFAWAETIGRAIGAFTTMTLGTAVIVFPSGRFEPRWSLLALPLLLASVASDYLGRSSGIDQTLTVVITVLMLAVLSRR